MPTPEEALAEAERLIPAEVRMISGCRDEQTSADVGNVASFQLPDPAGRADGACTSGLLKILYDNHKRPQENLSFQEVLLKLRGEMSQGRFTQIPQLSSSRPLDIHMPFELVPRNCVGTKRALLIGINYPGQQGQLSGCINDVMNMKEYIKDVWGFEERNIALICDAGATKTNILEAYRKLVEDSAPGDAVYCHYSGHGGRLRDDNGDEKDGYDETLVPVDFQRAGQIRDDDVFSTLVLPMAKGVTLTCVMDCCHSGTVLDLPFIFVADGQSEEMTVSPEFDFGKLAELAATVLGGKHAGPVGRVLADCYDVYTGKRSTSELISILIKLVMAFMAMMSANKKDKEAREAQQNSKEAPKKNQ